jgi:hypothetical protein
MIGSHWNWSSSDLLNHGENKKIEMEINKIIS